MQHTGLVRTGVLLAALALTACAEAEPPAHLVIPGADPETGRALIVDHGCGACHVVEGVAGANGVVGPPLENFARRTQLAGAFPNVPSFLVPWLRGPPDLKPGTAMPDLGLSEAEARDIASYLYILGSADLPPHEPAAVTDVGGEAFERLRAEQRRRLEGDNGMGIERAMEALAAGNAD